MSATADLLDLSVSDIRQYVYCPRIPFFRLGLRLPHRFVTAGMQEGILQHQRTEDLEHRRTLRAYGLTEGERLFDVPMRSDRLALGGRMDLVIRLPHEAIPVEFKNTHRLGLHHKFQLAAYALLAESHFRVPVRRTFVYFIPLKLARSIDVTSGARNYIHRVLNTIRAAVQSEKVPEGTRVVGRCRVCEFLTYCNDRW